MTIGYLFKKYPDLILNSLANLKNLVILLIDKNYNILDFNEGAINFLGLMKGTVSSNLRDFLPDFYQDFLPIKNSSNTIEIVLKVENNIEIVFKGVSLAIEETYLLILEPYRLTYNELIVKLSKINEQIVNIAKELAQKNIQLKEALNTIKRLSNIDPLTGILNRRTFNKILKREISIAKRHTLPLSLVMMDLDYFKKINDTYGHDVGDYVLKTVTKGIKNTIRLEDIFARLGGEEFALILPNTTAEEALILSERLRQKIEKMKFKKVKERITASFGITEFNLKDNINLFLKRADEALYEAKRKGRNCCVVKKA